jgi:hypothetical protein
MRRTRRSAYGAGVTDDDRAVLDTMSQHAGLTYLIGMVARADVWLESQLRLLWGGLVGIHSPARAIVPRGIEQLIEQCKVMVREWHYPSRVHAGGLAALTEARAAHDDRNRVVHDMWLPALSDGELVPDAFFAQQFRRHEPFPKGEQRTLIDVEAVYDRLRAAALRISGLTFVLTIPFGDAHMSEVEHRVMEGRFTLMPDGGAQVDQAGLPPRAMPDVPDDGASKS